MNSTIVGYLYRDSIMHRYARLEHTIECGAEELARRMGHLQQRAAGPVRRMPHEEQITPCPGPHQLERCPIMTLKILSRPLLFFYVFHNLCCELLFITRKI